MARSVHGWRGWFNLRGSSMRAGASVALLALACMAPLAQADDPAAADKSLAEMRSKAIEYLRSSQRDDGSWTASEAPGITGLVLTALLRSGVPHDDPMIESAVRHLLGYRQSDGGIYHPRSSHRNYETCIAIMAFVELNADGQYKELIAAADRFIRDQQWDEGEKIDKTHPNYGGAGYGSKSRPDLSNTQFLIEALRAAGAGEDDPAVQKALVFVSRSQNLETEANTTEFAAKVNDGGFYYTPAAGGASFAGTNPDGGLRSYASMTYAGLKSMIYAGVGPDDPRVKAAYSWIQKHYSVSDNPGLDQQGYFYYVHTFAKALAALKIDVFKDADGREHDWRADLRKELARRQKANGSWVNDAPRWNEGDPNLSTAYALLALSHLKSK